MPGMPWTKLKAGFRSDRRLRQLTDAQKWRYITLQDLAGECDAEGFLCDDHGPLSLDDIAWELRCDESALAQDLDALVQAGLIEQTDSGWLLPAFAEEQDRPQYEKREMWREQKRKQRENSDDQPEEPAEDEAENPQGVRADTAETPQGVQATEKEREKEKEKNPPSGSRGDHHANAPPTVAQLQSELPQVLADLDDDERNPTAVLVDWIARVSGRPPPKDAYKRVGGMLGNVFGNGQRGKQKAWRIPYREACRQAARLAIEAQQGNPEGSFVSYLEEILREKQHEEQPIDPDRYEQEFGDLLDCGDDWSPPAPILPEGTTKFAGRMR